MNPETFRKSLAATARAMAGNPALDVLFEGGAEGLSGFKLHIPAPDHRDENSIIRARGRCDALALYLRLHDKELHRRLCPQGQLRRAIFNTVEKMRCESVGSTHLPGARKNLRWLWAERIKPRAEAIIAGEVRVNMAEVIELLVCEALSNQPLPDYAAGMVDHWRARLTPYSRSLLKELRDSQDDQYGFALTLKRFIGVFGIIDDEAPAETDPRVSGAMQDDRRASHGDDAETGTGNAVGEDAAEVDGAGSRLAAREKPDVNPALSARVPQRQTSLAPADCGRPAKAPFAQDPAYRAYDTGFDRITNAQDLAGRAELMALRKRLDHELPQVQGMAGRLANRLQRKLYAKQMREWAFDREEGILDCGRLARVVASPHYPLSFKEETEGDFRDTVVSLLIDNSGSMTDRKITTAAICSEVLASTLERCGVKTEILGYTTNSWKGGRLLQAWMANGKQPHPGRLNELLHIVYKSADTPWRRARQNLGLMLRASMLKENIDGEALLWAHERLVNRAEERRILIVISDGAPMDDATLSANGRNYLDNHLRNVIGCIEERSPVELSAIGIGHDVRNVYRQSVCIGDVDDLGRTIFDQVSRLFDI